MSKRINNDCILVAGDLHIPFEDERSFDFLADIMRDNPVDRVVLNGDIDDSYNYSTYGRDLNADSPVAELKKLQKKIKMLGKIIPDAVVTDSNHSSRLWRKAKIAGIPREVLLPYIKMIGAADFNWKLHPYVSLTCDATREQWVFYHTLAGNTLNASKHMNANLVTSHHHTKQGIQRWCGHATDFFAVDTGCLIDERKYAFAYQKLNQSRPTKGVVLIEGGLPRLIPLK